MFSVSVFHDFLYDCVQFVCLFIPENHLARVNRIASFTVRTFANVLIFTLVNK